MNNEQKIHVIIDEVYVDYVTIASQCEEPDYDLLVDDPNKSRIRLVTREEFIERCIKLNNFSERWGLKIEERELSAIERMEYYGRQYMKEDESMGIDELLKVDYEGLGIPTKLITVTYNNEKIEVYE